MLTLAGANVKMRSNPTGMGSTSAASRFWRWFLHSCWRRLRRTEWLLILESERARLYPKTTSGKWLNYKVTKPTHLPLPLTCGECVLSAGSDASFLVGASMTEGGATCVGVWTGPPIQLSLFRKLLTSRSEIGGFTIGNGMLPVGRLGYFIVGGGIYDWSRNYLW